MRPMLRVAASASAGAVRLIEGRATSAGTALRHRTWLQRGRIGRPTHAIGGGTSRVDDVEKVGSTAPATLPVASSGALGENATVAERWTCFRAGILAEARLLPLAALSARYHLATVACTWHRGVLRPLHAYKSCLQSWTAAALREHT